MVENLGKNWILLRGLARESAHWSGFAPALQNAFPESVISTLDLPGTGTFNKEISPKTINEITEALRKTAFEQGLLEKPATILAQSLGAMVTWEWLHRFPGDLNGAVLINTSFKGLNPFYERLRWQIYPKFIALLFEKDSYKRELGIVKLICNSESLYEETARKWAEVQRIRPMTLNNTLNQLMAAAAYQPVMRKPKQPVLLLNSDGDRLVASSCSRSIQTKFGLMLKTHGWAGHDITLDDGLWVIEQIKEWITSSE